MPMALRVVGVIVALGLLFSSPAQAKMSFIPLPMIDTDPNAGGTFGFLPVFMFLNQKDEVTSLIAPDLTYNETTGLSGTFRYFGYPGEDRQYYLILSQSNKKAHDYELYWEDSSFLSDRYRLELELFSSLDPTARLWCLWGSAIPFSQGNDGEYPLQRQASGRLVHEFKDSSVGGVVHCRSALYG